jgi:hypothetical protein
VPLVGLTSFIDNFASEQLDPMAPNSYLANSALRYVSTHNTRDLPEFKRRKTLAPITEEFLFGDELIFLEYIAAVGSTVEDGFVPGEEQ